MYGKYIRKEIIMELIPINSSKLKIMLDENDMKEYNIGDQADCASSETRVAIRHILDRVKEQIGFDTEGSEIFVQLYTSKKGGCELFVTKSTAPPPKTKQPSTHGEHKNKKSPPSPITAQEGSPQKQKERGRIYYSFNALSDLCKICKLLAENEIQICGSVYQDERGIFFLALESDNIKEYARLDKLTFILEFGEREKGYDVSTYLSEHSKAICKKDVLKTLAQF